MSGIQALLLPVEGDLYALPMDWAREVVAAPALTHLVTAPPLVLGLFNLRGQIVPLLDTAALLGMGTVATTAFAVVINCPQGPIGLAASGLPQRAVLDSPAGPSELPGTAGLYRLGERVAALLDPAALLTPERLGRAETHGEPADIGVR
jgi:purine-binding chemotaxis protein CheW